MAIGESHRRKIQLVAGVTYSVSLPKKWVLKSGLKGKHEVTMTERGDGSLLLSSVGAKEAGRTDSFHLDLDSLKEDISQALLVLYYLGSETITLFSKKDIPHQTRAKIKNALRCMVGTEIVSEDHNRMQVKVLLDKSKVDINQIYYRIGLLINSSIDDLLSGADILELSRSEDEVDRLYHLISKIVLLSHINAEILGTSKIGNVHYLTSYQLIAKKLENIADCVYRLALLFQKTKGSPKQIQKPLHFVKEHLTKGMNYFINKDSRPFTKIEHTVIKGLEKEISRLGDVEVIKYTDDMLRLLEDVEEELTNISFYTRLMKENIL